MATGKHGNIYMLNNIFIKNKRIKIEIFKRLKTLIFDIWFLFLNSFVIFVSKTQTSIQNRCLFVC